MELRKLKHQRVELEEPQSFEAYRAVAELMGLSFLGMLNDDVVSDFKLHPGTLGGREWMQLSSQRKNPSNEMSPCWWVVATGDPDAPPSLVCRSLAAMQLESNAILA